jgi:hypothetical protein
MVMVAGMRVISIATDPNAKKISGTNGAAQVVEGGCIMLRVSAIT